MNIPCEIDNVLLTSQNPNNVSEYDSELQIIHGKYNFDHLLMDRCVPALSVDVPQFTIFLIKNIV